MTLKSLHQYDLMSALTYYDSKTMWNAKNGTKTKREMTVY